MIAQFHSICDSLQIDEAAVAGAFNCIPLPAQDVFVNDDGVLMESTPAVTLTPHGPTYAYSERFGKFTKDFQSVVDHFNKVFKYDNVDRRSDLMVITTEEVKDLHDDLTCDTLLTQEFFTEYQPATSQAPLGAVTVRRGGQYKLTPWILSPYDKQPEMNLTQVLLPTSQYDPVHVGKSASACVIICLHLCEYVLRNQESLVRDSPSNSTYQLAGALQASIGVASHKKGPVTTALQKTPSAFLRLDETIRCQAALGFSVAIAKCEGGCSPAQLNDNFRSILESEDGLRVYVMMSKKYSLSIIHWRHLGAETFFIADSHAMGASIDLQGQADSARSAWIICARNWHTFVDFISDLTRADVEGTFEGILLRSHNLEGDGGLNVDYVNMLAQEAHGTQRLRRKKSQDVDQRSQSILGGFIQNSTPSTPSEVLNL